MARIILPAANRSQLASREVAEALASSPATIFPAARSDAATRKRVLLIDDEPRVTRAMQRTLTAHCDVSIAESAARALEMLAANAPDPFPFDVVLCDVMMPGMTGMEFAEILGTRDPALRRRTVFLTGGAVTTTAGEFLERSDVHYLIKPVKIDVLVRTIAETALLD